MEKRIGAYIALVGLLNGSVAMFGSQHPAQTAATQSSQTTSKTSTASTTGSGLIDDLKHVVQKVESDFIAIESTVHSFNQGVLADIEDNAATIKAALTQVTHNAQTAQNITNVLEEGANIGVQVDNAAYSLEQKLAAQQAAKASTSTTTTSTAATK